MTPFLNPATDSQMKYNNALCKTRVLIEQTFGIIKRRFRVLHCEMLTNPSQAVINTAACVVLHNIGINRGDIINYDRLEDQDTNIDMQENLIFDGAAMRDHLVNTFFS